MQNIITWIIRFRRVRFLLTFCVFVSLYAMLVTYDTIIERDDKMFVKTEVDDISCYYENDGNVLPSTEDPNFSPKNKSVFFIDSTCKRKLTMMQACVAESAAIANPQWHIYVLLSFQITDSLSKKNLAQLLTYPNVNVARINIAQFAKGTAMESVLVNDIKKSKYPIEDTSNILKIVTLDKWGGIFVDSDMIVLKSFEDLPKNFVAKERSGVSSGILSFAKDDVGRNITSKILKYVLFQTRPNSNDCRGENIFFVDRQLAMTYDPKSRRFNRLDAILISVLKRICPNILISKSGECNGLKVFSEDLFHPIRIPGVAPYQDEAGEEEKENEIPYTYPLKRMDFSSYQSGEQWPSESLARIFCPRLFEFKVSLR